MAITYSIEGGADAAKFNIDATTGALTFKAAPDFEKPGDANADNKYEVVVKATDATGLSSTKPVTVTVTDVSEGSPPQITSAGAISVKENQLVVMTVTATDPDDTTQPPPGGTALPPLTNSGTININADNTVVENKNITGYVACENRSNITIRNCIIKHPGGEAGIFMQNVTGITIEDVQITNTSAASGQNGNPGEPLNIKMNNVHGNVNINRCRLEGAGGIYAVISNANFKFTFLEGHNMREPVGMHRGQLVQMNQLTGSLVLEDFSCINDPNNSKPSDIISIYECGTNKVQIRRGFLDGCNHPAGVMIMVEDHSSGVVVEDVDCIHHGNGAYSFYDTSHNGVYRRCRMKDQIKGDQGFGPPSSDGGAGPVNIVAEPGDTQGARFEACKYFNVNKNNLAWVDGSTFVDLTEGDFTPRAAIRNRTPGT
jgi:hypothetical protein